MEFPHDVQIDYETVDELISYRYCFSFFQGIERLRRNQQIQDEVKGALMIFYRHKEITKEEYKYIYTRAVKKASTMRTVK